MKISAVQPHIARMSLREPTSVSRGVLTKLDCIVVSVTTDDGVVGYGSSEPLGVGHANANSLASELVFDIQRVAPSLVGLDLSDVIALSQAMMTAQTPFAATAPIDIAISDARARAVGRPLHQLLGRQHFERIELVGWVGKHDPATTAAKAKGWVALGHKAIKIKIGRSEGDDLERIAAVRDAVGQKVELRVDANGKFAPDDAVALIRKMQKYGVAYCEQPSGRGDFAALAEIRRQVDMPILADEGVATPRDIEALHVAGAADLIKTRLMKQGGLKATLDMIECAESLGISCIFGHGFGITPSTAAELHVAAISPNVKQPCEMVGPLKYVDDIVSTPLTVSDGSMQVPTTAGLGISVDCEKLKQHAAPIR